MGHIELTAWQKILVVLTQAFVVAIGVVALAAPVDNRLSVLFIAVDDLKPALGCYGDSAARSPNIDRLAAEGVRFTSAYVQQSVCAASRSSMLTGLRPDTTGVTYGDVHFRDHVPDAVTLPEHFKRQGYFTQSVGKIFHGKLDDPRAWSAPSFSPTGLPGWGPEGKRIFAERQQSPAALAIPAKKRADRFKGPAWEAADADDSDLPDSQIADRAIAALNEIGDRPFFLAVGFYKPHLPFVAPKRYWDLHDPQSLPIASNPALPADAPAIAGHDSFELRKYHEMPPTGAVSDEQARSLVHGYYASVSYMDAQIGRVLAELERLGLRDKTIVVLWGDHGWHLGDHGLWCKHTNFESAVRVPLIISVPHAASEGRDAGGMVEAVDIYPTLAELCKLPPPVKLEGVSFAPLVESPAPVWKQAVFSQYPRAVPGYKSQAMGHSIRTDKYRFVEWTIPGTDFRQVELYDESQDPDENVNLANRADHQPVLARLKDQLDAGWQAALPDSTSPAE